MEEIKKKHRTSSAVKDRWNRNNYDTLIVRVKKGEKEKIKSAADAACMSLNSYIIQCIEQAEKNK